MKTIFEEYLSAPEDLLPGMFEKYEALSEAFKDNPEALRAIARHFSKSIGHKQEAVNLKIRTMDNFMGLSKKLVLQATEEQIKVMKEVYGQPQGSDGVNQTISTERGAI